jgi:hypothetical protein
MTEAASRQFISNAGLLAIIFLFDHPFPTMARSFGKLDLSGLFDLLLHSIA